ncbi:MAG: hypothetical protein KGY70_20355, partial [Bacteroidales bacterium]|nr:hypothetical protein [Bacteroidales bacterium]
EMVRLQLTDAKLVEELRKLNKQIPYTTQRLAYQFSSRFLENLLENYGSFYKVYIDSGIKLFHDLLLNEAAGSETISDDVYTSFVEKMMVVFLEETEYNGTNRQDLIQSLLTRWYRDFLISQDKATKETIKRIIEKWQGQSSPNKDIFTGQLMNLLEKESEWPDEGTSEDKRASTDKSDTIIRQPGDNKTKNSDPHSKWPGENNEYQSQADHAGKSDSSSIENIKNLFHDDQEKSEKKEYHYIDNSGLVLLTPYLQILFEELGLVRENQFINRQAQIRAAFLLHYLANNDKWPEEPELVFNKVMLGLPIEMPVPKNVELKDAELRECDKLLHAVIENWGALKNTTPQGLREGFLQRPGKLSKVDNGWKLNVEQDTIDILLDNLPWSYQIVSFPWMKQVIFVKWN